MCAKNQILAVIGIGISVFIVGCTNDVTPIVEPPQIIATEALPTQSKASNLTATSEAEMTESIPHVSPYVQVTVTDVEIRFLETDPVQVELVIRGTVPDQCKYGFYSVENRVGQNVKVSLAGIHPADRSCPQVTQNIEYVLPLGRDMPEAERGFSSGDYMLTVNNYQTDFTIQ